MLALSRAHNLLHLMDETVDCSRMDTVAICSPCQADRADTDIQQATLCTSYQAKPNWADVLVISNASYYNMFLYALSLLAYTLAAYTLPILPDTTLCSLLAPQCSPLTTWFLITLERVDRTLCALRRARQYCIPPLNVPLSHKVPEKSPSSALTSLRPL